MNSVEPIVVVAAPYLAQGAESSVLPAHASCVVPGCELSCRTDPTDNREPLKNDRYCKQRWTHHLSGQQNSDPSAEAPTASLPCRVPNYHGANEEH